MYTVLNLLNVLTSTTYDQDETIGYFNMKLLNYY